MDFAVETGLQIIVSVVVLLTCVGAIPFAMNVTRRLATIDTRLEGLHWQEGAIEDLRKIVADLHSDMAVMKVELHNHQGRAK